MCWNKSKFLVRSIYTYYRGEGAQSVPKMGRPMSGVPRLPADTVSFTRARGVGPPAPPRASPSPIPPQDHNQGLGRYKARDSTRLAPSRARAVVCSTRPAPFCSGSAPPPGAARGARSPPLHLHPASIQLLDMTTGAHADLEAGHVTSRRGGAAASSASATAGQEQPEAKVSAYAKTSPIFFPSL